MLPLAALAVGACTSGGTTPTAHSGGNGGNGAAVDLGSTKLIVALKPFDDCDGELAYLKDKASAVVGPYGIGGLGGPIMYANGGAVPAAASDSAAGAGAGASGGTAGPAGEPVPTTTAASSAEADASGGAGGFSGTNVQEAGVDEPDEVKTDGKRIVAIAGTTLYVIDASGATPTLLGSVALPANAGGGRLVLDGTRALVLTQFYGQAVPAGDVVSSDSPVTTVAPPNGGGDPGTTQSQILSVDLSDPAHPTVASTLTVDGTVIDAREVGDVARVVVSSQPEQLPFVYPANATAGSIAKATEVNKAVIQESTIDQWLPQYSLAAGGKTTSGRLVECSAMSHPDTFAGDSTLSVLTVDLTGDVGTGEAVGVLADGQSVYASASNLYVTTTQWVDPSAVNGSGEPAPTDAQAYTTEIHQFDITGTGPATYLASGAVDGHLLNSYSLSEQDGHLRVATTEGPPWGPGSSSTITVLDRDSDKLVPVGSLAGLAGGEQIYAVRYIGTTAYVVTFLQTDPLFVVDLSDPTKPVVAGELELTGYSSYLHPVGDGLLLGVGQDADPNGSVGGTSVSLFDVHDPANPTRIQHLTFAGFGGASVQYDPHAFLWWPDTATAMLPVQFYNGAGTGGVAPDGSAPSAPPTPDSGGNFVGAIGVHVDPSSLAEVGRVSHAGHGADIWGPDGAMIERSLVVGGTLFTFSQAGLGANDLSTFAPTGFVDFPAA
jgi:hypothetical protein